MKKEIIISTADGQLRAAILEDGRLVEIFIDTPDKDVKVGSIYMGRVQRVIQGMNAAFVDIGLEQDAFLHFSDVSNATDEFKELLEDGAEEFDELDDEADLAPTTAVSPKKPAPQPRKPARSRTPRTPREKNAASPQAAPRPRESAPATRENTAEATESKETAIPAEGTSGTPGQETARRRRPNRRGGRGSNRSNSGRGRAEGGSAAGSPDPGPAQQDMAFNHENPSLFGDPDQFRQDPAPSAEFGPDSDSSQNHDFSTESGSAASHTVTDESGDRPHRSRRGRRPRRSRQRNSPDSPQDTRNSNQPSSDDGDDDAGQVFAGTEDRDSTPKNRPQEHTEHSATDTAPAFDDAGSAREFSDDDAGDDAAGETEGAQGEGTDAEGKPRRRRRRGGRRHKRKKTGDTDAGDVHAGDAESADSDADAPAADDPGTETEAGIPTGKTDDVVVEAAPAAEQPAAPEGRREGRGRGERRNGDKGERAPRQGSERSSRGERSERGERGRGQRSARPESTPAPDKELPAEKAASAPVEDRRQAERKPAERTGGRGGSGRTQGGGAAGRSAEAPPATAGNRGGRGSGGSGGRGGKDLALPTFFTKRAGEITINLERGQDIVVQVTREPYASKGVRVSTRVSLPGRFLVLLPLDDVIGVSRKIQQHKDRRRLHRIARSILPQGYGCIIRTVAEDKDEQVIREDLTSLIEKWKEVEKKLKRLKAPAFIYEDSSIANTVIRDLLTPDVSRVVIDDKEIHRQIRDYVEWAAPALVSGVELYNSNRPIFEKHGIERELEKTFQRKIYIPSGGYIIMEQTEAMMVIDVNSGRYADNKEQEMNALRTNTESAREIARQLRLRDVGGLVVVDFIDLYDEKNRRKVYDELRREMRRDRAKSVVLPMTQFGLVQITRQRIRQQIIHSIAEPCPTCSGSGMVQPRSMVLNRIERWLEGFKASTESRTRKLELQANPIIVDHLTHGTISTLARMMLKYRVLIKAVPDEKLSFDTFRVLTARKREDITDVVSMI